MRRLKLRHRIGLLVALATVALVVLTIVTLVLGRRNEAQVDGIETRYVPLLELDRDLKRLASDVTRALEDAAGAGEQPKLAEADGLRQEFLRRVGSGATAIRDNGRDPDALVHAFEAYYTPARALSAALVVGTPAAQLTSTIEAMRHAQRAFLAELATAASPDRSRLGAAFAAARATQHESLAIDIIVACVVLLVMAIVSARMIRRMVRSLQAVSDGVERLARGDFTTAIDVPPGDEIADVAREANRTATRLREYREEADREAERARTALFETQRQARAAESANKELESFSYSVSHDLRAPLRGIDRFSQALLEDEHARLSDQGKDYLRRIRGGAQRMAELIDDLLRLSRVSRAELHKEKVDFTAIANVVIGELRKAHPEREVRVTIQDHIGANADARLLRITLENLLGNAWKFTAKATAPAIDVGAREEAGELVYFVRDNGAGFDMQYADRLFGAFQRLHADKDFPGTGIGLATVQRIVVRHGGRIWVDAAVGTGATFMFTLP